jgi:hypothetical protein
MAQPEKTAQRGSAKIFTIAPDDHEELAKALGLARSDYTVKWWWKYGQPAIDRIVGVIEVDSNQLGPTISGFMQMNGTNLQVTAQCFPYGIPTPEVFRVQVEILRQVEE